MELAAFSELRSWSHDSSRELANIPYLGEMERFVFRRGESKPELPNLMTRPFTTRIHSEVWDERIYSLMKAAEVDNFPRSEGASKPI